MRLGPVMVGIGGLTLSAQEAEVLVHPAVGGVILFSRNYESPEQISALVTAIHTIREPKLLVAVDHEGGRVQRFRSGFSRLPPARIFGEIYEHDRARAKRLATAAGWLMAVELRAVGVDFSFAPVLDLDRGISQVIGDRAFHADPEVVTTLAHSYMEGMERAGMAATGKHFPGHGAVEADSHLALPVDERSLEDLLQEDLIPFERLIRWGLAAVMPAHLVYPHVDNCAAGFSTFWLQKILRQRLGFQGVIFSDDLEMEGASVAGGYVERAHAALEAGCDMVLVCNDPQAIQAVVEGINVKPDPVAALRLMRMHGRHLCDRRTLLNDPVWQQTAASITAL